MGSSESELPAVEVDELPVRHEEGDHVVSGAGRTVHYAPTRGKASSWIAVIVMILAFTVGGFGVVFWNWWVVGFSAGVFGVAFLASLAGGIMNDVH